MQTPKGITLQEFHDARAAFLRDKCVSWPTTGVVTCAACGERIKCAPVVFEIHQAGEQQCIPEGDEFEAGVPYCPQCEELPASRGCVHG